MATGSVATAGEHEDWFQNHDPLLLLARKLATDSGKSTRIQALDHQTRSQIDRAGAAALASPHPLAETAIDHVFA